MLRILLSLILLFLPFCSYAAEQQPRFDIIADFSGGLNSHISDLNTPNNQAVEALNVRTNDRYSALSKREPLLLSWDAGSSQIMGLHRYYKSDDTIKTIIASSTYLDIGDESASTVTHISNSLSDGKRWKFVTYKNIAIGSNGYDQPIKYDGYTLTTANTDNARTASDLCAQLGAPFAQLSSENGGNDLDASSWYQYKVAFYDGSNYYFSNARSNPILTGSTVCNITLTDVPIGPVGTTHRYVYRTVGQASRSAVLASTTFYLVKDLADNTTTTFDDAVTDDTADDDAAPAWSTVTSANLNVTPPTGKYITLYKERLWVSGNTTYKSDVYFSDDGNPDYFDPDDFFAIREDDGDEVTFLENFLGILTVGKTNTVQKLYADGDASSDWYVSDPFPAVGCYAPYTVAVAPSGIVYLGRGGLYSFNGQYSSLISDAVTNEIDDIDQTNIDNCVGIYHNNQYYLAYTSVASGELNNNRVLLYDFTRNSYVIDTGNINCFTVFNSGTDVGTLVSGSSLTDGYVNFHSYSPPVLSKRYKSEFDAGTFDNTYSYGSEKDPGLAIGWDCTVDTWLTELQSMSASINTVDDIYTYLPDVTMDSPATSGSWVSPVYSISASELGKLYWNENLGSYGDITFQVRLGASSSACQAASWETAVTNPNGSDLSAITVNNYIQFKINFTTSDIAYTPYAYLADGYLFRMFYVRAGSTQETSILSVYKTGWKDFGVPGYKKQIKRIKVFYTGAEGEIDFNIKGDDGDIDKTFTIDLSVSPDYLPDDNYSGDESLKVYTFYPPVNSSEEPSLIAQLFQYTISEDGTESWEIKRIETMFTIEEIY